MGCCILGVNYYWLVYGMKKIGGMCGGQGVTYWRRDSSRSHASCGAVFEGLSEWGWGDGGEI